MDDYEPHNTGDTDCPGCNIADTVITLYDRYCPGGADAIHTFTQGVLDTAACIAARNVKPGREKQMLENLKARLEQSFEFQLTEHAKEQAEEAVIQ